MIKTVNYKKIFLIGILIMIIGLGSIRLISGLRPTRATVENFLENNSCDPSATKTDSANEYSCAAYLRRHTALFAGQIFEVPKFTFLFIFTPFDYFNYFEPGALNVHVYIMVLTSNDGILVYNPVNGKYIGHSEDLLSKMSMASGSAQDLNITSGNFVSACDARNYLGEEKIVEGKIVEGYKRETTVFLNFGMGYPDQCFMAVIFSSDWAKFPQNPQDYYSGKTVRVTGTIREYNGNPEIILNELSQIEEIS